MDAIQQIMFIIPFWYSNIDHGRNYFLHIDTDYTKQAVTFTSDFKRKHINGASDTKVTTGHKIKLLKNLRIQPLFRRDLRHI